MDSHRMERSWRFPINDILYMSWLWPHKVGDILVGTNILQNMSQCAKLPSCHNVWKGLFGLLLRKLIGAWLLKRLKDPFNFSSVTLYLYDYDMSQLLYILEVENPGNILFWHLTSFSDRENGGVFSSPPFSHFSWAFCQF